MKVFEIRYRVQIANRYGMSNRKQLNMLHAENSSEAVEDLKKYLTKILVEDSENYTILNLQNGGFFVEIFEDEKHNLTTYKVTDFEIKVVKE